MEKKPKYYTYFSIEFGKIPFFSQYISFTLLLPLLFNSPFTKILLKLVSDIREIL